MVTTACNAATMPVIGPYLDELQKWLSAEGFGGSVLMMLSNGGVVSADDAARFPIRLVESGPAAGALAGIVVRPPHGRRPAAVLRHGRHHRQGVPDRARRARAHEHVRGRPHLPLQEGLRVPGVGAVGRPRRDRRRRRQPRPRRPVRPAQGRARIERRRSRPGQLRPRWHASRRSPTPTCCSACSTPTASSAATCRSTLAGGGRRRGTVADRLGLDADGHRVGHPRRRQPEHGRGGAHARRRAGRRPARRHRARVRRRRAGARLRRGRAARVADGSCSRSTPACCRRSARSCRRCASTSPVRWSATSTQLDAAERDAVLDELRAEGRRVLLAAGVPASSGALPLRRRRPLCRAGQRDHGVGRRGRSSWPATADDAASQAFEAEYRRIYGLTIPDVGIQVGDVAALGVVHVDVVRAAHGPQPATAPTPTRTAPVVFTRGNAAVATPVYRRGRPRRRRHASGARRSSRSARPPSWCVPAGGSRSRPTAADRRHEGPGALVTHDLRSRRAGDPLAVLIATVNEQARALQRAAFSPIVREAGDLANAVFDRRGRMVAQAVTGTPGHINSLAIGVANMLAEYPLDIARAGRRADHQRSVQDRRPAARRHRARAGLAATAGSSRSSVRRSTTPTSAATASAPAGATASRKVCGSRSAS